MRNILLVFILTLFCNCVIENIDYLTPIVISDEPQNVLSNSAVLGGAVLGEGGKEVVEYGIVWSTHDTPTINDNKIIKGSRLGSFSETYSVFNPSTTYHYRAYGINSIGVGYGKTYKFSTGVDAPCDPITDNYIDLGTNLINNSISISSVDLSYPNWAFDEGNVEFETSSFSSTARITVQFNEVNKNLPLTGEYTVVTDPFGNDNNLSTGEAQLYITDFGFGSLGGATAVAGTKFYVENENNSVTIIFCDTPIGDKYVFNGKFSYE